MSLSELKQLLIRRINPIDDVGYLRATKTFTDSKQGETPYELSDFEKQKIAKARQQVKDGKTVPHEKVVERTCSGGSRVG